MTGTELHVLYSRRAGASDPLPVRRRWGEGCGRGRRGRESDGMIHAMMIIFSNSPTPTGHGHPPLVFVVVLPVGEDQLLVVHGECALYNRYNRYNRQGRGGSRCYCRSSDVVVISLSERETERE